MEQISAVPQPSELGMTPSLERLLAVVEYQEPLLPKIFKVSLGLGPAKVSIINEGKAMKKRARNHVNRNLSESDGAPAKPTGAVSGEFVTETFEHDGARQVTVYVPPDRKST